MGDTYHADIVDLARVRNTFSPAIDHAVLENISEVVTDGLENAAPTPQERIEFVDYVLTSYLEWNKSISAIVEEMGKVDEVKAIISMLHARQKDRRNTTEQGITYNAYLILDEKVTLIDTVKRPFSEELVERIKSIIDPAKIDVLICNHIEMDHSGKQTYALARPLL